MKKLTQEQRILSYLELNGKITSMEAFEYFGATRLSAIIYDLRKKGYHIESMQTESKNRYGDTVYYATYVLYK